MQNNQDKETSTDGVKTEYKRIQKIPVGGQIFSIHPGWPWDLPNLLYSGSPGLFPGGRGKAAGASL